MASIAATFMSPTPGGDHERGRRVREHSFRSDNALWRFWDKAKLSG